MLHIIQNDPEVPPGSIIEYLTLPYLVHHLYRDGHLPQREQISALIVLGGAMGANDVQRHPFICNLKKLIREVVAARIPYLGICLGGQLLAAALGAQVISSRWEEIGHFSAVLTEEGQRDPLFQGLNPNFLTFQWHHDSFDIPAGGLVLAASEVCPHQAFRIGESAWGVQFHPEVTEEIIRCWCDWDKTTVAQVDRHLVDFTAATAEHQQIIRTLLANFQTIVASRT